MEKWCDGTDVCARAKWYVKELLVPVLYPNAVEGIVETPAEATEDAEDASADEEMARLCEEEAAAEPEEATESESEAEGALGPRA